jgi:polysaccharide export outer membrane protein
VEKLDDQRRIILLRELQDSNLRLAEIRAKLQGVGEKLQYTGMMKSQLARGLSDKPQITVIRKGEKDRERFKANEDFELQPGDVVEIALQPEHIAEAPTQ